MPSPRAKAVECVEVYAPARIHITLCDLGRATARAYGGIGFAIDGPQTRLSIRKRIGTISDDVTSDRAGQAIIESLLAHLPIQHALRELSVTVVEAPPPHSGLGSKTSLVLSVIYGANELLGLGLSRQEMQLLSGRGGTSGVGVHSFFDGGLIWDAGHPQDSVPVLLPSSASAPLVMPSVVTRVEFPDRWQIGLIQGHGRLQFGEREIELFARQTPIPAPEVKEVIALIAHGIVPAFREGSLLALASALGMVNKVGFKAREVACQSGNISSVLSALHSRGIAAGMSSLGPLVYAIVDRADATAVEVVEHLAAEHGAGLRWTNACNNGARHGTPS